MSADYRSVPLAVVGMACRFPGADDLDAFWRMLKDGRCGITEFPPERLDQRLYYNPDREAQETSYSRIAGIVPTRPLNRDVCPIPDDIAAQYDETHLAMCEVAYAALRDSGDHTHNLPPRNTGVYIGNCTGSNLEADLVYRSHAEELAELLREIGAVEPNTDVVQSAAESFANAVRERYPSWEDCRVQEVTASAAARLISSTLNLHGPSMAVDAACVSSFMALHLAGMALHRGRIDAAIVGAFSYRNWWEMVLLSPTQTISPDGSCPFAAAAGGMVPADGYAAVFVKTLPRALEDGDRIHGVIRALGISSDGRGKGFWAPRQAGQVAAVRQAYEHGIEPQRVQYVEAHATSTQLGDATEMATLQESLGGAVRGRVPVGSVKANIGHTLEVAGLAGLIKTLLAMRHGVIPASIHCEPLNPGIDWANSGFRVPAESEPWPEPEDGQPRRAGVDAFGIGGLNVHVVVDESPAGIQTAGETANETANDEIAVIGVAAPVMEATAVRDFLQIVNLPQIEPSTTSAEYTFDWKKHRIPPKEVANANPLQFLLLDAAVSALEHAGYGDREFDRSRAGAVVGTRFSSDFSCDALLGARLPEIHETIAAALTRHDVPPDKIARIVTAFGETLLQRKPARKDVTGSLSSSTLSSRIAKHLDLMGGAVSIDAGLQSPAAALTAAVDLLHSGTNDLVICAVGQNLTDVAYHEQLAAGKKPGFLEKPGFSLGTAAAAVILKRVSDAQRDGDTIHSILPADVAQRLSSSAAPRTPGPEARSDVHPVAKNAATTQSATVPADPGVRSAEREDLERSIIADIIERTALPPELVGPDSRLRDDLGMDVSAVGRLSRDLHIAGITGSETVRQIVEAAVAGAAGNTEPRAELPENPSPHSESALHGCVLRMVEKPANEASGNPTIDGTALILGDNPAATALAERLAGMDVAVVSLSANDTIATFNELEQICAAQQPAHLFLMTGRDENESGPPSSQQLLPLLICERWLERVRAAGLLEGASLVTVTSLGGDFGIRRSHGSPKTLIDGALCRLLKAIADETQQQLAVRIIDAPANEPARMIAAAVCRELASNSNEIQTATVRGKRYVIRAVPRPAEKCPPGEARQRSMAAILDEFPIDSPETKALFARLESLAEEHPAPSRADFAMHEQLRPHVAAAPFIDDCFAGPAGGIAEVSFDPDRDPFLTGHRADGIPLLPAVAAIETCAQAASVWSKGRFVVGLRDQQIQNGFRMAQPRLHRARVLLSGAGEEISCQLVGDFYDKQGRLTDPFRTFQSCVIELADAPREIPPPDFGPLPDEDWADVPYPDDWREMGAAESGTVFYGPELRTLKRVHHRPEGSWGRMIAPPTGEISGQRKGSRWHTPAALLDGALFLCDLHAVHNFGTRQLPQLIERIDFGRLPEPGEECIARVLFRGRDGRRITWDVWILGRDGTVILATQGFQVVTLR